MARQGLLQRASCRITCPNASVALPDKQCLPVGCNIKGMSPTIRFHLPIGRLAGRYGNVIGVCVRGDGMQAGAGAANVTGVFRGWNHERRGQAFRQQPRQAQCALLNALDGDGRTVGVTHQFNLRQIQRRTPLAHQVGKE